ncbi:hypothetical protein J3R83DRAFT_7271 [Lanmaoa asiatica]|nr:hypothetical protein J3R83DRAFT_7271 [Lanmaoa asiatica]
MKQWTAQRHDEAITQYSAAISLDRDSTRDLFVKRSKARMAKGLWKDALDDAKQAIAPGLPSPWGCESVLMEWAQVNLMNGLWKGVFSAACDVSITPVNEYHEVDSWIEVEGPEAHDLSSLVSRSRSSWGDNGRDRVFPSNDERTN